MTSALAILERSFKPLAMPVMVDDNPPGLCGVYLLIDRDDVVYVGYSDNVAGALHAHARSSRQRFDRAAYLPIPASVCIYYVGALRHALRPRYNDYVWPTHNAYDAEILHGLGLRDELTLGDLAVCEPVA